ncbi:MAG TPA: hypothetical protein VN840_10535 [Streptosporangiaceae bacterium]|nr:hypothetical protein [Streptosporangiaceae bacterium]
MRVLRWVALAGASAAAVAGAGLTAPAAFAQPAHHSPFINLFHHTRLVGSTVPNNGDINPYGVAVVRRSQGRLHRGDVLVSNFNAKTNLQGTGTTIVEVSPGGQVTQFAHISASGLPGACPGGIGLTTALVVVHDWVIVGSLPSKDGSVATSQAGCLLVLDSQGKVRETISGHGINGPWDMTAVSGGPFAVLFVANVLNGTKAAKGAVVHHGTVLRLVLMFCDHRLPMLRAVTEVGSGFSEQSNATTFVNGPTGLGFGRNGALYVADTGSNRITVIWNALFRRSSAGTGTVLTSGGWLDSPLGLAIAPNGDVLTVNGGNGRIVETSPEGTQVATRFLDRSGSPPGSGALFGLAVAPHGAGLYYVDDAANTLRILN